MITLVSHEASPHPGRCSASRRVSCTNSLEEEIQIKGRHETRTGAWDDKRKEGT